MSVTADGSQGPISVVVVDDQPLERAGLSLIIDSDDELTVVGEAASGEDAIALVQRLRPNVVLMDIRMPGMGGLAATEILTTQCPESRVAVLTTFGLDEYAYGSLQAGASAFLLKSMRPETLTSSIKTVASGAAVVEPGLTAKLIDHFLATKKTGAVSDASPAPPRSGEALHRIAQLSPRETDVLRLIARGLTNTEISAELFLAEATVKSHINSLFAKLHLRDRVHAVILGREVWSSP